MAHQFGFVAVGHRAICFAYTISAASARIQRSRPGISNRDVVLTSGADIRDPGSAFSRTLFGEQELSRLEYVRLLVNQLLIASVTTIGVRALF